MATLPPSGMVRDLLFPTPLERATDAVAKALGYEDASDPRFIAGGTYGSAGDEHCAATGEDRSLLRDLDEQRALRSYDALAERGER